MGFEFATYPLLSFLHFLDPELLRTRLLESCFYLHIQPPLFNLFVGLVLKLAPHASGAVFHGIYLALGAVLFLSVFWLFCHLGISRRVALIIDLLFLFSPSFIWFEHWLFYAFPCTVLMVLAACFLLDVFQTGRRLSIAAFFACILLLCATWSLFHISYFAFVFAATLAFGKGYRKRILVIGLVPFALLLALYVKNLVLFDSFGLSTIMGRNLWINTVGSMPWEEREGLVESGELSPISRIARWNALEYYPEELRRAEGFEGIPALRQETKSTGAHNFNNIAHIAISNQYMADALVGLRRSPRSFLVSLSVSWFNYFRPAATYFCSFRNAELWAVPKTFYDYAFYGKLPFDLSEHVHVVRVTNSPPYLFLLLGLPLLLLYGLMAGLRGRTGGHTFSRPQRLIILFMAFNIAFVAFIGNTFDYGETNRYRFTTDPFYLAFLALFLQHILVPAFRRRCPHETGKHCPAPQGNRT